MTRVLIDTRVVDDGGAPVMGLEATDFRVLIDGKVARVESAQWMTGTGLHPAPDNGRAKPLATDISDTAAPPQGRLIVFLFQKSMEPSRIIGLMRMLIEGRKFLDNFSPVDRVAVLSYDSHLEIWLDFTNDRARIDRVFAHGILFEKPPPAQEHPFPSLVARLDPDRAKRTNSIEDALRLIADALEPLPGSKSLVLIGHGFGRLSLIGVTMENVYERARVALQAARTSVFCLDVTDADYHSLEAGLQIVAGDTGGFFVRTHIFTKLALDRLAGALAGYYVLFVEKPDVGRGTHRVDVELTRRQGHVLARSAYVG